MAGECGSRRQCQRSSDPAHQTGKRRLGARHSGAGASGTFDCHIVLAMHGVSSVRLLEAWERASTQPPALRAITLLSVAYDEESADRLATLSMGQRDARLLRLREQTFGTCLN